MSKMEFKIIYLVFLWNFNFIDICKGQEDELIAELANARLPSGQIRAVSIYNGVDIIYILSGYPDPNHIYSYNVTSDILLELGTVPWSFGSQLFINDKGEIVRIEGLEEDGGYKKKIYRYNPSTQSITFEAHLVFSEEFMDPIIMSLNVSDKIYISYRMSSELSCFNMQTLESCGTTNLLNDYYPFSKHFIHGDYAYIFGYSGLTEKLNLLTLKSEETPPTAIAFESDLSVVFDGSFGYFTGRWKPSEAPTDGIFKFNPETFEYSFLKVLNCPQAYGMSSVYVESLNRIYLIGGEYNRSYTDTIHFIDLSKETTDATSVEPTTIIPTTPELSTTIQPDQFTCSNRTDGVYPHPLDCSSFIICVDNDAITYLCPPQYLYDPELKACNDADIVKCDLTCADLDDGRHSHPYYCSWFISCQNEEMEIIQCPPPTLFDPKFLNCVPPQFADCQLNKMKI